MGSIGAGGSRYLLPAPNPSKPACMMMTLSSRQPDPPIPGGSGTDWQIGGELKLQFGRDDHVLIDTWLLDVLASLQLDLVFLNRILKSAREVTTLTMQSETVMMDRYTHLLIYIPASRPLTTQTWGFFRIEKTGTAARNENSCDRTIEFYLYLERQ